MVTSSYEGTPRANRIKRFLMRTPQPASVLGVFEDGKEKKVKIAAQSRYKWADATKLLYDCVTVTALDADGEELRSLPIGPDDEAELHEDAIEQEKQGVMTEFRAVMAKEVTGLVREIARAMVDVADRAASRHESHMTTAFNSLVGLVQAQSAVSTNALRQLMQAQRALATPQQSGGGGDDGDMLTKLLMTQVLSGAAGMGGNPGGAAPSGNGATAIQLTPETIAAFMQRFSTPAPAAEPEAPAEEEDEP